MKVYLIGYMGVGKSTVGKRLAQRLNYHYCDLDQYIEKSQGRSVSSLFREEGEVRFREMERSALLDEMNDKTIISTGGGAPCFHDNMEEMLKSGMVVWLKMPVKSILNRLKPGKATRPLIANLSDDELSVFIKKHLGEREEFYKKAHIHFDAMNMNQKRMDELELAIKDYSK